MATKRAAGKAQAAGARRASPGTKPAARTAGAGKDVRAAVREICLSLPDAEEFVSHGSPNFRARGGKVYAVEAINSHGDGRVALWLKAPPGSQQAHVGESPEHFFVPPYVGPKGWLGVNLDRGLSWRRIAELVYEAYAEAAPAKCVARMGEPPAIDPPTAALPPEAIDPLESPAARALLERLRTICLALPETCESKQYGHPVFKVGTRNFAMAYDYGKGPTLAFRVGVAEQGLYLDDARFSLQPYLGHHGWIAFAASAGTRDAEIESLALASYRHFATRLALAALERGGQDPAGPRAASAARPRRP